MNARGLVVLDGRAVLPGDAVVSVYDRGFLYGDGVFESLRTYGGVAFALDEHLERLFASARALRIAPDFEPDVVRREALDAIARVRAQASVDDVYVRVMITRGVGRLGPAPDPEARPTRAVLVEPLAPGEPAAPPRGLALWTVRGAPPLAHTSAAAAKAMRYLAFVVATAEARERGADEALFVNERCEALECASSNVFAVMGDALVTPPVSAGILPGITRARVVALARADGMRVDERCFSVEAALPGEIFVTSSVRGVAPATRVDGRAVGGGGVGAVTRRICELFRGIAGAGGPAA